MQHIRHTRQALSRLFSPERCRFSIARALDGRALGPSKAVAASRLLGKGLLGDITRSPTLAPMGAGG